jgi:hypothetical protein
MDTLQQLEQLRLQRVELAEGLEQHKSAAKLIKEQMEEVDAKVYALIEEENSPQERLFPSADPTDQDEPMPKPKRGRKKTAKGAGVDPSKVQWPDA